ncbi:MAG: biopolymer transporter ExbD [Bacteroidetes bacterium]|nr:biopolymer transporter ExbD [Bacteroidota bacterium]MBS1739472.1 biopolymer transporter ExbD [Bacteroidota bacterium]MBS1775033.1 biopolymer transporter ExbD [Bacteroidota bacterium]
MPKLKMPRKSTNVDMTAMCDVAFLLLTFFMLATRFKPDEPVTVVTPNSISEIPIPDNDIMLLTVDPKGRVFFSIDNPGIRRTLIEDVNEYKSLGLTPQEMQSFAHGASVGVPFAQLKSYLAAPPNQQKEFDKVTTGIPTDTVNTSDQNELAAWIRMARNNNPKLRIAIKADGNASYPEIKKVIKTLENWKIFKFNLITGLKAVPPGTAAYTMQNGTAKPKQ